MFVENCFVLFFESPGKIVGALLSLELLEINGKDIIWDVYSFHHPTNCINALKATYFNLCGIADMIRYGSVLSGTGLPRLSWKRGCEMAVVLQQLVIFMSATAVCLAR